TPVAVAVGIGAGVNLLLNFLLVPYWGREGAALGTVVAAGISVIYLFVVSQSSHKIDYHWRVSLYSLVMSVGLVAIAWKFVPQATPAGLAVRFAMLSSFVPLGFGLGLFRRQYFRDFLKR
ncbi:MAG: polysaccharide biosynthesis C-terminal domain-containing protein, partial [Pirellulales bacterium]|nr:polysaccharide biosynthesis C-terminal domain-containing protein [Pirellulales bacterium]